jgi:hypothetical protein
MQLVAHLSVSICSSQYCLCVPWLVGSTTPCLEGYELALTNPERSLLTVSGSFWLPALDQKALILLCATSS